MVMPPEKIAIPLAATAFAAPLTTPPVALTMPPEEVDIWPTKTLRAANCQSVEKRNQ